TTLPFPGTNPLPVSIGDNSNGMNGGNIAYASRAGKAGNLLVFYFIRGYPFYYDNREHCIIGDAR
ncbi:MAG: hypothetical protein WBF37_01945, partial [Dehalococcoidia bacterium]